MSRQLLTSPRSTLRARLLEGHPIEPGALDDSMYRGISLGMPAWVDRLAWKTFIKTFHRDRVTGALRGWNLRLEQTGVDGTIEVLQRRGEDFSFGHYEVMAREHSPPPLAHALLIDYGRGGNPSLDPVGFLRDPIVSLDPDSVETLLGWSYLSIAGLQVPTPSYFLLERIGRLSSFVPSPRPSARERDGER